MAVVNNQVKQVCELRKGDVIVTWHAGEWTVTSVQGFEDMGGYWAYAVTYTCADEFTGKRTFNDYGNRNVIVRGGVE